MNPKARVIAFYLPQFHPIPENDHWWGTGFTEWTNVGKAKPLFRGHKQPRVPADLGYYDLRLPEIREAQAKMAREAGIEGFMYWHYWFGNGVRLLERPFEEVLRSGKPDFPFCLGWANHSWTNRTWDPTARKRTDGMIAEQLYPGLEDALLHFQTILPAFRDPRYIRVDGKPLFFIYAPHLVPDPKWFIDLWRRLATENGLPGIHFVAQETALAENVEKHLAQGFDSVNFNGQWQAECSIRGRLLRSLRYKVSERFGSVKADVYDFEKVSRALFDGIERRTDVHPTIVPQWDRSPRAGKRAVVYTGATPALFGEQVERAMELVEGKPSEHRLVFLRSWNEWGEGNYMEPDLDNGKGFLEALRAAVGAG